MIFYRVNVVPLSAPSSAYKFKPYPGETWAHPDIYGTDIYVPWNLNTTAPYADAFLANASSDRYLCYNLLPTVPTDTIDEFTTSTDPEDPIFYSTCFYKFSGNTFDDYATPDTNAKVDVPWKYQSQCIDCASQSINSAGSVTPKWKIADTCTNCDLNPSNATAPALPTVITIENGTRCDGLGGYNRLTHTSCSNATQSDCTIQLVPIGRAPGDDVTVDECRALAAENANCTKYFYMRNSSPFKCYCYSNNPCCLNCSRLPAPAFVSFELTSVPDPSCSTGVLTSDSLYCCSGSCAKCSTVTGVSDNVGYCNIGGLKADRTCNKYGPPCIMPVLP